MSEITDFFGEFLLSILGIGIGTLIPIIIGVIVGILLINALFLRLALWIRKVPTTFARVIGTAFYMMLAGFLGIIPMLGIFIMFFVQLWIIHKRHFVEYLNAFLIWLIAYLLPYAIIAIILAIFSFNFF